MREVVNYILVAFVGLILLVLLIWGLTGINYLSYSFWAPKFRRAQYTVWQESPQFRQGMIQELDAFRVQYNSLTDKDAKEAIESTVRHRIAGFDLERDDVSPELRLWLKAIKK